MTKPSPYSDAETRPELLHLGAQVPVRLPDGEEARVVRARRAEERRRIMTDHIEIGRRYPRDHDQHRLLVRDRRPGVRRLLRVRRARRLPRPRPGAARAPSRAPTRCATRRSSPAWRCRSARRSTPSTAPPPRAPRRHCLIPADSLTSPALVSTIGTADNPLRVAIVGSGPAGFYAAEALFDASRARRRGRHVRPPADPVRPGPRRRRPRPPEDQERDQALREDRRPRGLSLLRQRRGRRGRQRRRARPSATTR